MRKIIPALAIAFGTLVTVPVDSLANHFAPVLSGIIRGLPSCNAAKKPDATFGEIWDCLWDPFNTESFHLDVAFDPTRLSFIDIQYVPPFVQTTPPDLSMLSAGLVQETSLALRLAHLLRAMSSFLKRDSGT